MKQLTSLIVFFMITFSVNAQTTPCEVAVEALKGTYEGECAKGKANGEGTATGTDIYKGTFKNGYPDGTGKYTWKNGDYYYGNWKKGMKEGKGEMHTTVDGKETVQKGFWKKDDYKGEYEKPYIIHNTTSDVGRVEVNKIKGNGTITVEVQSVLIGGSVDPAFAPKLVRMTDLIMRGGTFMSKASNALSNKEITVFKVVTFPFRAQFVFGNATVDIELFEEGIWDIRIPINN